MVLISDGDEKKNSLKKSKFTNANSVAYLEHCHFKALAIFAKILYNRCSTGF